MEDTAITGLSSFKHSQDEADDGAQKAGQFDGVKFHFSPSLHEKSNQSCRLLLFPLLYKYFIPHEDRTCYFPIPLFSG